MQPSSSVPRHRPPALEPHPWTPEQAARRAALLSCPVEHVRLADLPGIPDLVRAQSRTAFQARQLGLAAETYLRRSREDVAIIWSLAGSLFSAGMRQLTIDAIRANLVDVLVCTGALFEQDMLEALGHRHHQLVAQTAGDARGRSGMAQPVDAVDDGELQTLLIDRVYDHLLDELALRQVDATYAAIADSLPPGRMSSRAFLAACGAWLAAADGVEDSVLQAAHEAGVPIFVPALNDCSVGVALAMHQHRVLEAGGTLDDTVGIDSILDFRELAAVKLAAGDTGLVVVGGGVPKNYAQDAVILADLLGHEPTRHAFGIQLSVADERDGGLSGSTLREAISWGKNDPALEDVMVWGEASLTFPLLVGHVYHERAADPRPGRRLAATFTAP